MKIQLGREGRYLAAACVCFTANALSILLLPFTVVEDSSAMTHMGYLLGALFWTALLAGILFFGLAWHGVRESGAYQQWKQKKVPGILGFFRSRAAWVIDPLWVLSLAVSMLGSTLTAIPDVVTLAAMSLAIITFYLHMICNGRVYRYMIQKEGKDENSEETGN